MRSVVLASAALLCATSSAAADAPQPVQRLAPAKVLKPFAEHCASLASRPVLRPGESLKPRKLTELPLAKAYHSVLRVGRDGCPDPLLVGYLHNQER